MPVVRAVQGWSLNHALRVNRKCLNYNKAFLNYIMYILHAIHRMQV